METQDIDVADSNNLCIIGPGEPTHMNEPTETMEVLDKAKMKNITWKIMKLKQKLTYPQTVATFGGGEQSNRQGARSYSGLAQQPEQILVVDGIKVIKLEPIEMKLVN